jgi:glycine/D-amino acid oxidase-like deaminating enzyme
MPHQASARVAICGAGVIGAAVAYYLALRGVAATVIERCGVACAASGKAGGFLALDPLARKSFQLHAELSQTLGADYGYRRLTTLAVAAGAHDLKGTHKVPEELAWLDSQGIPYAVLGTPATTAQVHPARFTHALLQAALERGAPLRMGCVDGLEVSQGQVRGVRVDGQLLPTD